MGNEDVYRYVATSGRAQFCEWCGKPMTEHGYMMDGDSKARVCPGNWIVTSEERGSYVLTPGEFETEFEPD
jgi:hypothetical protein